jgi:hypothetical protein
MQYHEVDLTTGFTLTSIADVATNASMVLYVGDAHRVATLAH